MNRVSLPSQGFLLTSKIRPVKIRHDGPDEEMINFLAKDAGQQAVSLAALAEADGRHGRELSAARALPLPVSG